MWEAEQQAARIMGDGARGGGAVGGAGDSEGGSSLIDKANAEGAQDAGPVALQLEMASEAAGDSAVKRSQNMLWGFSGGPENT